MLSPNTDDGQIVTDIALAAVGTEDIYEKLFQDKVEAVSKKTGRVGRSIRPFWDGHLMVTRTVKGNSTSPHISTRDTKIVLPHRKTDVEAARTDC